MLLKSRSRATAVAKQKAARTPEPLPKWPALQPLVPTSDLTLETVLDDQVVVIRNLFTTNLCRNYISFLSTLPLTTTPGQPKKGDAVRVNDRIQFNDNAFAQQLWASTGLKDLVTGATSHDEEIGLTSEELKKLWGGEVCGLNPRIRIYRYRKGQFFDQHYFIPCTMVAMLSSFRALFSSVDQLIATIACVMAYTLLALHICCWILYGFLIDLFWNAEGSPTFALALYYFLDHWFKPDDESNAISLPTTPPIPAKTTWTLLIYLTGPANGCVGGETVFYPELGPAREFSGKSSDGTEPVVVGLEVGMALLHKHGQDCLLHEGREVMAGEKWVIRSDLCVKR